jgi:hypothetical protein
MAEDGGRRHGGQPLRLGGRAPAAGGDDFTTPTAAGASSSSGGSCMTACTMAEIAIRVSAPMNRNSPTNRPATVLIPET